MPYTIWSEPNYSSSSGSESYEIGFGYLSGIEDYAARIDFDYSPNPQHNLKFLDTLIHTIIFSPGEPV